MTFRPSETRRHDPHRPSGRPGARRAPFPCWGGAARCYNSDDGADPCQFRQFGGNGSFTVRGANVPADTIAIVRRGVANGFADYGGGNLALPGTFHRSREDRACWVSDVTGSAICAY